MDRWSGLLVIQRRPEIACNRCVAYANWTICLSFYCRYYQMANGSLLISKMTGFDDGKFK